MTDPYQSVTRMEAKAQASANYSRVSSTATTLAESPLPHKAHHVAQSMSHTARRVTGHLRDLRQ